VSYIVKEIFYTLQGEGAQAGRPAVFCRFAGCNLWSGGEADRATAICRFCDTDFVGTSGPSGGKYETAASLADSIAAAWRAQLPLGNRYVVCTGGEPLLQLDGALIRELHARGCEVAVETNGTILAPSGLDWLCVSPKAGAPLNQNAGDELKLAYPQRGCDPAAYASLSFRHFFLQPLDDPCRQANTEQALRYCLDNPVWRLSLQTHKLLGIP
jgi:7-carboxy-7-deazaguanine synthase (Cx14CxxC type)